MFMTRKAPESKNAIPTRTQRTTGTGITHKNCARPLVSSEQYGRADVGKCSPRLGSTQIGHIPTVPRPRSCSILQRRDISMRARDRSVPRVRRYTPVLLRSITGPSYIVPGFVHQGARGKRRELRREMNKQRGRISML